MRSPNETTLGTRWKNHVIAPLRVRATLLAGFQRLLEKPRPRFHILRSVTVGHYRLRLETLGEQATSILGPALVLMIDVINEKFSTSVLN